LARLRAENEKPAGLGRAHLAEAREERIGVLIFPKSFGVVKSEVISDNATAWPGASLS
jgi:hypothetical protein